MGEAPAGAAREGDAERLRALMRRYQQGEIEAFEELYALTLAMFRSYLTSLTADRGRARDLTQEAYLQLHRSRHTYDPSQPPRPWLLAIARHVWLNDQRRHRRRFSREVTGWESLPDVPVPPEVDGLVEVDVLRRALASLPHERREALVLHHVYGLSFREIARVVGTSEGGARIRASRAMSELRETLGARPARGERGAQR